MKMQVRDVMTRNVKTCSASDPLTRAAQLMWDHDIGCVPVLDPRELLAGVITDRDICMAAYTQGRALDEIPVFSAMASNLAVVRPEDDIEEAERMMSVHQVRRIPVVDAGRKIVGIITVGDLLNVGMGLDVVAKKDGILTTLRAIGTPRHPRALEETSEKSEPRPRTPASRRPSTRA